MVNTTPSIYNAPNFSITCFASPLKLRCDPCNKPGAKLVEIYRCTYVGKEKGQLARIPYAFGAEHWLKLIGSKAGATTCAVQKAILLQGKAFCLSTTHI